MPYNVKEHLHRRHPVECPLSGGPHERRVMRDAAGTVDFEYCARCGARRYRVPDDGTMTAWDRNELWRARFSARRVFEAMVAAAQATHPGGRETGRREAITLVAGWLGAESVGSWYAWSLADCTTIERHARPILVEYADLLVTGEARHLLHASRARGTTFPRLTYRGLVLRDVCRQALERWVAAWRA